MEIQDRLKLYKDTLEDYNNLLSIVSIYTIPNHILFGFCHYFNARHKLDTYCRFQNILPELYYTRP